MRLCFVFDGLGCGGIERVGIDYCNELVRCGHEVMAINLNSKRDEFADQLDSRIRVITKDFSITVAPERYCQLIKRVSWGRFAYPAIYLGLTALNKLKSPILMRDLPSVDVVVAFSGHYNDLTFVANGYVKSKAKIAWLHGAISSYLLINDGFVNLYKRICNLVYLADDGLEEFAYANRYLQFNMKKIYNPIMISERELDWNTVKELESRYGRYVLMCSRFNYPHKDQPTVIEAIAALKAKYKMRINLVLVGDGPDLEKSQKLAERLGVEDQVAFVGFAENPAPYYAASSVVVHASVAGEGLPTAMLEGMAFGKPVVATDSKTGPREILGNDEWGLLCGIQKPTELAEKLYMLLTDKNLYDKYANKGKERLGAFAKERSINEFLGFADSLI